jgi:micrococcal nuclease
MKIPKPPTTLSAPVAARSLYTYAAAVEAVYDADTMTVMIDLGLNVFVRERVRLARINAPEVRGAMRVAGLVARDWVRLQVLGVGVYIKTTQDKKGKYGRYVAEVYYRPPNAVVFVNLSDRLVTLGMAVYQEY